MFTVKIETENAAFDNSPLDVVANMLCDLAGRMRLHGMDETGFTVPIKDENGNTVGRATFEPKK